MSKVGVTFFQDENLRISLVQRIDSVLQLIHLALQPFDFLPIKLQERFILFLVWRLYSDVRRLWGIFLSCGDGFSGDIVHTLRRDLPQSCCHLRGCDDRARESSNSGGILADITCRDLWLTVPARERTRRAKNNSIA